MRAILVISVVAALALAACGGSKKSSSTPTAAAPAIATAAPLATPEPSGCTAADAQKALDAYKAADPTIERFDNAREGASGASKDLLPPVVAELESVRTAANAIALPDCAAPSKQHLVSSISGVIQALTDYQAGKPDADVEASVQQAATMYERWKSDLASLLADATRK